MQKPLKPYGPLDRRNGKAPRIDSLPRSSRKDTLYEDPLQFLWAISYSDLLMVLMSFFIIFFQMNDTAENSPLKYVVLAVKKAIPGAEAAPAGAGALAPAASGRPGQGAGQSPAPVAVLDAVAGQLKSLNLPFAKTANPGALMIDLPDDLYKPGKYAVPEGAVAQLAGTLEAIKPYAKGLSLVFIGHTDASKMHRLKGKIIDSNLVLSNLRATRAVEFALERGFDPRFVAAQGAGENSRSTRSLSIRISEKDRP